MGFLDFTLYHNTLRAWGLALAVVLVLAVVGRILARFLLNRLRRLASHTRTSWDDLLSDTLDHTKAFFYLALGVYVGAQFLSLPTRVSGVVRGLAVVALLFQGGIWANRAVQFWLKTYRKERLQDDPATATTMGALGFLSKLVVWTVVLLLALDNLGVDITALVAGLGVGGIAVALAVQNILGDLFASLSIVLDKPFVIGDFLVLGEFSGSVEYIGLKTTRVRSLSGEQLVFSNSDLLSSRLRNYGRMQERRVLFSLGVTYQTPRDQLKRIPGMIRDIIKGIEQTRFDRSHFMQYGDFSLNVETVYYVLSRDYNVYMDLHQQILLGVHEAFEREGIEFAYPTQTVFVERGTE